MPFMNYEQGDHIGMKCAQELLHGITQSSLSGKGGPRGRYPSIIETLELSSSSTTCTMYGERKSIISLSGLTMKDLISGVTKVDKPNWVNDQEDSEGLCLSLRKGLMFERGISMKNIKNILTHELSDVKGIVFSPNAYAEIYIDSTFYGPSMDIVSRIDEILVSGVRGLEVSVDETGMLTCPSRFYGELLSLGIDVICNDPIIVYSIEGLYPSMLLIKNSLLSHGGISELSARLVCNYMTMTGRPMPFTKQGIEGRYGPMFDMYYGRPRDTLIKWVESGTFDECTTPYSKMMLGSK